VESLSEVTKSYYPSQPTHEDAESDPTIPPFLKVSIPSSVTLLVYLDTARPLSEPKWAKTGDVQDWLKSMFGRMFWVAGDAAEGWEKKIQVINPDPVCSFYVLYSTVTDLFPASNNLDSFGRMVAELSGRCNERTTTILEDAHD